MLLTLCSCGLGDITKKQGDTEETISESSDKQDAEDDEDDDEEDDEEDEEPEDLIDLDGLSTIESKDNSKVKITKKEVQKDAVSGFTMRGGDALNLTISNDGDTDVTKITIYIVGYNKNHGLTKVQPSYSYTIGTVPYVQCFESTETTIKAGASEKIAIEVDADKFVGVKAIVASYTTSNGKTYENPIAEDWVSSVQLGKHSVLD